MSANQYTLSSVVPTRAIEGGCRPQECRRTVGSVSKAPLRTLLGAAFACSIPKYIPRSER